MIDVAICRQRIGSYLTPSIKRRISTKFKEKESINRYFLFTVYLVLSAQVMDFSLENFDSQDNIRKPHHLSKNLLHLDTWTSQISKARFTNHNFWARYTHGNGRGIGLRIVHWNKASSFLANKKDELAIIIDKYKPHVFGLSEANFFDNHDQDAVQFPDYTLHTCPTLLNPDLKVSRVVVYTHKTLIVKPRPDLMNDRISAIWLELGLPNQRKILVCNVYREWGYLNQIDRNSHSRAAQLERWEALISKWEEALAEEKEVILLGDINIDSLKWMRDDLPNNDVIYRQKPLLELLFAKIFPEGVSQLVNTPTHGNSCLDHLYSNKPEKLSEVSAFFQGGSDHRIIFAVRILFGVFSFTPL